jgi:hypothetical protein
MKKENIKNFNLFLNENSSELEKFVYLLTNDGHRDSVNLQKCALDDNGLKKILIEEASEIGEIVVENSIEIQHSKTGTGGWIYYKYIDSDDELEDGKYGFFKLKIV